MTETQSGDDTKRDVSSPPAQDSEELVPKLNYKELSAQERVFRTRARRLRTSAALVLWGIIFPLIGGAMYAVIAATTIAGVQIAEIQSARIAGLSDELFFGLRDQDELRAQIDSLQLREYNDEDEKREADSRITDLQFRINQNQSRITLIQEAINEANRRADQEIIPSILNVNITRLGILAIIAFAVTLMIGIYRFNMRRSVYYEGRADALKLLMCDVDPKVLQELFESVTPAADFGRAPKMPIEHLTDIVGKIYPR